MGTAIFGAAVIGVVLSFLGVSALENPVKFLLICIPLNALLILMFGGKP